MTDKEERREREKPNTGLQKTQVQRPGSDIYMLAELLHAKLIFKFKLTVVFNRKLILFCLKTCSRPTVQVLSTHNMHVCGW